MMACEVMRLAMGTRSGAANVGQDSEAGQGKNPIKRFKVFGEKGK
jgi:hypothetical protein